ncbi:ArsR family transcriptional regulator [Haloferax mediterranei ATCC 33500]|uniref:ArsR family regulatory protein n=1 Tax=Haloferax mediterranei (strain ATCC 33500 / DSM 1411 / JCM 8866 / NBRC 14739 / NCIMB 2177 / R-4) TaxID=523841 RepID=I3R4H9_HALMT|nr:winged helix-turn-helix domain-containing protein [Haloferax mediterranei]AFK19139.1 ArsR family regulatory protein [Haloferax mediterranei ATCC 33500]AHZ21499.1 ArsR family transcriptional regulator [Haloferax mediterranei ATCC 33500]EMA03959.1 ArsR family regulatory protein [Haloferax mediterranei ATCC 33500]MDX5989236.1 winged helix-turn-helix domain-containing protein [Haloferax mediterranei ATCC 33500]QCQ75610.1 ArsR family transcriptional regulator [Haloferax mediterranei ATCC 33500]
MSGLLPSDGNVDTGGESAPRVHWLDDDETEQLIGSLSCDTAREILSCLQESPATATELAEMVDTSIQNARHHLGNLLDADLVRVAGTRYSEKGREMKVYASVSAPLVVCVGGDEDNREDFADAISSFLE